MGEGPASAEVGFVGGHMWRQGLDSRLILGSHTVGMGYNYGRFKSWT